MHKISRSWFAGVALGLISSIAHAGIITYDFAGTGSLCQFFGSCDSGIAFTGSMTVDVNPAGPSGPDSNIDPGASAQDDSGWVTPSFIINWAGGSYQSYVVAGETYHDNYTLMEPGIFGQGLVTRDYSLRELIVGATRELVQNEAEFRLQPNGAADPGLGMSAFPEPLSLTPQFGAFIGFFDTSATLVDNQLSAWSGIQGGFELDTLVQRPTSVPEPATLILMCLGVAGLGLGRRRHR